jgi:hypothetical protein
MILLLYKYYSSDKIKKNKLGKACSTYKQKMHRDFWWGTPRARDHLHDRCTWDDNIKMDLQEIKNVGWGGGTWTGLIYLTIATGASSMRCRALLGYLRNYSLLKDTAPCSKLMYSNNDALTATVSTLRMAGNLKPRRGDILLPNKEICLTL